MYLINLLQTLYTYRLSSILYSLCQFRCIFTCIKILLDLFCSYETVLFILITWCFVLIAYTCVFVWMFVFVLCVYECVWVQLYVCVLITDAISSKSALSAYLPSPSQSSHSPWIMTNYYYYYYNHHHYYFHNCALTWHHIKISLISPRSSISNDNANKNDNSSLLG